MPYADVIASSFPAAWVFGRIGCSVAHDHPGLPSDAWFAVQYPGGGRFDLGLYEMLLTIPLALAFLWLRKKPRPWGFYVGAITIAYAPVRFALDFLRVADPIAESGGLVAAVDPRYAGLTPAQWACFGSAIAGRVLLRAYAQHGGLTRRVRGSSAARRARQRARRPRRSRANPERAARDARDERQSAGRLAVHVDQHFGARHQALGFDQRAAAEVHTWLTECVPW